MAKSHVVALPLYVGYISKITNLDNSPGVVLYLESIVEISGHKKQSRYQIQLSKSLHAFKLDIHTHPIILIMTKYESLTGDGRQSQNGFIDPRNGQFTTHKEVEAHVKMLEELGKWNFPTPASRKVAQGAKADFLDNARKAVAKRNQASGQ